ncbi:hypothetical protein PVMG_05517 [Plasmodium vivax Mauritania I]|uniref:VIR protein n=1 Tax=Plasmodium vivax Mauritania I TaxID=1035515 RepID=A0A0J9TIN1_PLAVI|nr:hypothetical protein PVMG_05517 [Plasmodium vivax Mauritania I]
MIYTISSYKIEIYYLCILKIYVITNIVNLNNFIYNQGKNSQIIKNICEQYLKLYTSLTNLKNSKTSNINYKKDYSFVNYWLNDKIRESELNGSVCVDDFYEIMEPQCSDTLSINYTPEYTYIYHINQEDFNKMKLLYSLYENYSILDSILSKSLIDKPQSLSEPSSKYYDNYKKARKMCYGEKDKFCEKLDKFKSQYKALYTTLDTRGEEISKYFKRLPNDENNIISTAVIGSMAGLIPFFGLLYKVK